MACKTQVFGINSTEIFHKAMLSKIILHFFVLENDPALVLVECNCNRIRTMISSNFFSL